MEIDYKKKYEDLLNAISVHIEKGMTEDEKHEHL